MGAGEVMGQKLPPRGLPSNSTLCRTLRGPEGMLVSGALASRADMSQVVGRMLPWGQKDPLGQGMSWLGRGQKKPGLHA